MAQLLLLLPFIAAAPFLKSALVRRGVSEPLAYSAGFGLLAFGVFIARVSRLS